MPGVAVEGRRSIWALDRITILDGGFDGDVDTQPAENWLFQTQGIFVPMSVLRRRRNVVDTAFDSKHEGGAPG